MSVCQSQHTRSSLTQKRGTLKIASKSILLGGNHMCHMYSPLIYLKKTTTNNYNSSLYMIVVQYLSTKKNNYV